MTLFNIVSLNKTMNKEIEISYSIKLQVARNNNFIIKWGSDFRNCQPHLKINYEY